MFVNPKCVIVEIILLTMPLGILRILFISRICQQRVKRMIFKAREFQTLSHFSRSTPQDPVSPLFWLDFIPIPHSERGRKHAFFAFSMGQTV